MIDYARHEARLNTPDKDGVPARKHLEVRAKQGSKYAIEQLEGVGYPYQIGYLYEWAISLVGRSGVGVAGLSPLSHQEIGEWSRLTGNYPSPLEVEALIQLDAVMRHPDEEVKKEEPEKTPTFVASWPVRKNNVTD